MPSINSSLPLVLVIGATGSTGRSIVKGLVDSGNFRVAALVRAASQSKPVVQEFCASGVEIRLGGTADGEAQLRDTLAGVTIVVSAIAAWVLGDQKELFRVAKEVGVQRVVPCDFGTPGKHGVRALHDEKLAIHDFIEELGIGHTYIDVGWWMQIALPLPTRSKVPDPWKVASWTLHGTGDMKMLLTDLRRIGAFVARIVADPRTLGRSVIAWEVELTELEIHEIGERASGEADVLKAKRAHASTEEIVLAAKAETDAAEDPVIALMKRSYSQYVYSMQILGENSLEYATKTLGYLDARALYPDLPQYTLEEFAKEFYSLEEPGQEYIRYD
ncbi:NAD-P-binding protein [Trametes versicolor FP-101664 SS1]|uniref:NAD-P-binding protein n=1 Tax=Trametes versicolor (strain FP-101664) TaxID=717944 RepID=UPI0004621F18|nr:NAD-P-binding protein [Trametes versicolor FP-101664 SS1]EIW53920.1 NAD-P-binding protein [Trametes versicolor FP-101664 SS1]